MRMTALIFLRELVTDHLATVQHNRRDVITLNSSVANPVSVYHQVSRMDESGRELNVRILTIESGISSSSYSLVRG